MNGVLGELYKTEPEECSYVSSHVNNNSSVNKGEWKKGGEELSNAIQQVCLPFSQESNKSENITEKETVKIVIKHNKVKEELTVSKSDTGDSILQVISDSVGIPKSKLKLIHKGKIATSDNIKEMLFDKLKLYFWHLEMFLKLKKA